MEAKLFIFNVSDGSLACSLDLPIEEDPVYDVVFSRHHLFVIFGSALALLDLDCLKKGQPDIKLEKLEFVKSFVCVEVEVSENEQFVFVLGETGIGTIECTYVLICIDVWNKSILYYETESYIEDEGMARGFIISHPDGVEASNDNLQVVWMNHKIP